MLESGLNNGYLGDKYTDFPDEICIETAVVIIDHINHITVFSKAFLIYPHSYVNLWVECPVFPSIHVLPAASGLVCYGAEILTGKSVIGL